MKKIYFGFSRASTCFPIFSWAIMWAEGTNFSHCYIRAFDEEIQEDVYYQASRLWVNCVTKDEFLREEIIVKEYEFQVSLETWSKIKKFAMDNMGKPYGIATLLGFAYVQIMSWVGIKAANPIHTAGKEWVCSEFAYAALGEVLLNDVPVTVNDVTPKVMMVFVSKLPKNLTGK